MPIKKKNIVLYIVGLCLMNFTMAAHADPLSSFLSKLVRKSKKHADDIVSDSFKASLNSFRTKTPGVDTLMKTAQAAKLLVMIPKDDSSSFYNIMAKDEIKVIAKKTFKFVNKKEKLDKGLIAFESGKSDLLKLLDTYGESPVFILAHLLKNSQILLPSGEEMAVATLHLHCGELKKVCVLLLSPDDGRGFNYLLSALHTTNSWVNRTTIEQMDAEKKLVSVTNAEFLLKYLISLTKSIKDDKKVKIQPTINFEKDGQLYITNLPQFIKFADTYKKPTQGKSG